MAEAIVELEPLVLHTAPAVEFDDDRLFQFCQQNKELRIERDAEGNLIIMAPEGASSSSGSATILAELMLWAKRGGHGRVFGSSVGYILPDGAMRSPDVSFVRKERLRGISKEQFGKFLPLCPDFAVEVRSPSDSLRSLQRKSEDYIENGTSVAWLVNPDSREVHIYAKGVPLQILKDPAVVSGEPALPGFELNFTEVWQSMEPEP